uniref:Uncharacterized protein n=1 Tax=Cannabis sativa TaxID=3483 RepID=A0A803Q0L1_CANSA
MARDSCMTRVAAGVAVGGAVGGAVGAVYGTYEAIRYKVEVYIEQSFGFVAQEEFVVFKNLGWMGLPCVAPFSGCNHESSNPSTNVGQDPLRERWSVMRVTNGLLPWLGCELDSLPGYGGNMKCGINNDNIDRAETATMQRATSMTMVQVELQEMAKWIEREVIALALGSPIQMGLMDIHLSLVFEIKYVAEVKAMDFDNREEQTLMEH